MAFLRQTWTLTRKNILIALVRHPWSTVLRAFLMPILFMFFISYAKNFFVPPADYGIGSPHPVRSLSNALKAARGGRNQVVFVNNGYTGGDIENLITIASASVEAAGKKAVVVDSDVDLLTACRSSLRGVSACVGAASFHSSPTEGDGGIWNYTLRFDGSFGTDIYVNRDDNDAEIYILPFQHYIDSEIATLSGSSIPDVDEYPYTTETTAERARLIRELYMMALINILAVAFFIGIVGITYQLTGHMAQERELGMSQLIEAMTPNKHTWRTQAARLLANHLAFDIIYLPSWIIMAVIMQALVFPTTNVGIIIVFHILAGLSLSSFSIMCGSLFRKAQLSGISVVLVSIVLAIVAQVTHLQTAAAVAILSILFPPMTYTYFVIYVAQFEHVNDATNLVKGAPNSPWQIPGIVFWIFLIIQILVFPVIGAFVERSLYGTASKSRKMTLDSAAEGTVAESIRLTDFSKHWRPSWWHRHVARRIGQKPKEPVRAVNNLSLSALRGQIMVLLGANGSGKSTTLDAISGLNTITSGSIEVDGTGGLGLCPQKNVLWDELTVYEHVQIFNSLKAETRDSKAQTTELIRACDLDIKLDAKAKTLSGGQKRKLQLAMMFTGGSRVCCVDEVSSGLDPLSRRKIWDILLAERGARTMLLTTHFLDEADFLSDHIVVLSKGCLKAEGSAVQLKHDLGGGYRIVLDNQVVQGVPKSLEGLPRQVLFDQTVYRVSDSRDAAFYTGELEREGVQRYQVNGPTIEDVFLRLAEEVKDELPGGHEQDFDPLVKTKDAPKGAPPVGNEVDIEYVPPEKERLEMSTGRGTGFFKQAWVLFRKRFTILRRNYLPYVAAVLIPVIAGGLVTQFLDDFGALSCEPADQSDNPTLYSGYSLSQSTGRDISMPVGPSSAVSAQALSTTFGVDQSSFHLVDSLDDFEAFVKTNYATVEPGGFFLTPGSVPTFAWAGDRALYYPVLTQNILDNVLANTTIVTQYQEFAVPFAPSAGDTLQLVLYFGLAMCAFSGFFALYPTMERLRKVRALHYSNGIRAAPLWIAYTMFDFLFALLVAALVTIIFVSVSGIWYYPGYLFVVLFLFGFTSILMSYVVSLFVTSQLAAFAFMAGGQAVFFLLYFVIYMCITTYAEPAYLDREITIAHFTFGLITPAGQLLRALFLSLNEFSILCHGDHKATYPGGITVYGGPILYLIGQGLALFAFLVWWDSGYKPAFLTRSARNRIKDIEDEDSPTQSSDVLAETNRAVASNDTLRVLHLTKHFGRNPAVRDLTFSVPRGQVFALLGPNGAGKSTTISLIRGDVRPSAHRLSATDKGAGDVLIDDLSITANRAGARAHLGVCPQFDAMDQMTVVEHLAFYARARGVQDVSHNVAAILSAVGLGAFKDRMAAKLSGGNKRKLSLGIALMGNPGVLLLDEPSSGMDAAAKRVMWRTLGRVREGRAVCITTHSMEEADCLAERAGIMAGGMLAVGGLEELRRVWGDGLQVHVVLGSAPASSVEEMTRLQDWVVGNVPGAVVDERVAHGQMRFLAPAGGQTDSAVGSTAGGNSGVGMGIAELFGLLEKYKEEVGIRYYSVGRTTLDQVFLRIVGQHNIEEEGHRVERERDGMRKRRGWRRVFGKG